MKARYLADYGVGDYAESVAYFEDEPNEDGIYFGVNKHSDEPVKARLMLVEVSE